MKNIKIEMNFKNEELINDYEQIAWERIEEMEEENDWDKLYR